jgi:PTH2 family peptidyl-tRNA hydrolase
VLISSSQAKIALKATSEQQLLELQALAKTHNLCARSVRDAFVFRFDPWHVG